MKQTVGFSHFESFCVLLFAVSVFIWKPGIYVSSGLIVVYLGWRTLADTSYREMVWRSALARVTLAMFALGLLTALIGMEQLEDLTWMARKTLFLPAIIFFTFALAHTRNKELALSGLIASFWIASLLTLWRYDWNLAVGGRMQGTWPQGTWDALLGLFLTFLVLQFKWDRFGNVKRITHLLTILMALLMLLLAGGRAPWLATIICVTTYVVLFQRDRRVLIGGFAALLIAVGLSATVFEHRSRVVIERFSTIADTTNVGSNWIRIQLWTIGIAHMQEIVKNEPLKAVFGSGAKSYNSTQIEFFNNMPFDDEDRTRFQDFGYPSGDTHNNYIDSALRNGLLWTCAIILYLIWLCTLFSVRQIREKPEPLIALLYLCIVAMVYTVTPHFVSFFFALFITILLIQTTKKAI